MSNLGELRELTRIRFLAFLREPEAIFWVFIFPIILTLILGLAFKNRGIETQPVGILARPGSEALAAALAGAPYLKATRFDDDELAWKKLRAGAVTLLIEPREGKDPLLHFDPARPEGDVARLRTIEALERAAGRSDRLSIESQEMHEAGSRYIDWLLPGILGVNIMSTGLWGTAFALINNRNRKLVKRYIVTPMRRSSYLLSFVLARMVFLLLEISVIIPFGCLVLGVPFRGGVFDLVVLAIVGGLSFAGLGLLVASRASSPEVGAGLINMAILPMWLCSGVFFSYERFPEFVHPFIRLLPLTALNDALRRIMLDGDGLLALTPEVGVQLAWGILCVLLGLRLFKWE